MHPAAPVAPDAAVEDALALLGPCRAAPVVDESGLVGIVTKADLRRAAGIRTVREVMRPRAEAADAVDAAEPIGPTMERMLDSGVHHLPVVDDGVVVGIVVIRDLLDASLGRSVRVP